MQPRVPFLTRRLAIAAGLLLAVIVVGTIGFATLERWTWFEALYFTVMNVTTVGSAQQTDVAGKWWTIVVVAVGFGVLTYTVLALVGYVIEGHLGDAFESRRMRRRVARMTGHYIVCGFGRVGREIAGRRLASLAMRPTAVEFVDTILSATNGELLLEDFTIQAGSRWIGRPLGTLVAEADEAIVLALKRAGRLIFRPTPETVLGAGDELVAAGPPASIKALEGRL